MNLTTGSRQLWKLNSKGFPSVLYWGQHGSTSAKIIINNIIINKESRNETVNRKDRHRETNSLSKRTRRGSIGPGLSLCEAVEQTVLDVRGIWAYPMQRVIALGYWRIYFRQHLK